jgi:hypothetical protein
VSCDKNADLSSGNGFAINMTTGNDGNNNWSKNKVFDPVFPGSAQYCWKTQRFVQSIQNGQKKVTARRRSGLYPADIAQMKDVDTEEVLNKAGEVGKPRNVWEFKKRLGGHSMAVCLNPLHIKHKGHVSSRVLMIRTARNTGCECKLEGGDGEICGRKLTGDTGDDY